MSSCKAIKKIRLPVLIFLRMVTGSELDFKHCKIMIAMFLHTLISIKKQKKFSNRLKRYSQSKKAVPLKMSFFWIINTLSL